MLVIRRFAILDGQHLFKKDKVLDYSNERYNWDLVALELGRHHFGATQLQDDVPTYWRHICCYV